MTQNTHVLLCLLGPGNYADGSGMALLAPGTSEFRYLSASLAPKGCDSSEKSATSSLGCLQNNTLHLKRVSGSRWCSQCTRSVKIARVAANQEAGAIFFFLFLELQKGLRKRRVNIIMCKRVKDINTLPDRAHTIKKDPNRTLKKTPIRHPTVLSFFFSVIS